LPDIYIIKPVWRGASLVGYAATMAHHSDIGGIAPGSVAVHATEIFQEGLRLPLVKIVKAGREDAEIVDIILKNTRNPVQVLGDLRAQIAACRAGERGLLDLVARHGESGFVALVRDLHSSAEALMREAIRALPKGSAEFEDFIDGVGEAGAPIPIRVAISIAEDEITLDFTGTAAQVKASINAPVSMAYAISYCAVRGIAGADIPNVEGYTAPIKVIVPEGTILNPRLPAACGARGVVGYRAFDAVIGALAKLVPDRVFAPGEGGPTLISIGGEHGGQPFVITEVLVGNWGGRATRDGLEGVSNPAANLSNQPVEIIEAELPIRIDRYELVADSGGPGRHRGGLAFRRDYRILAEEATMTIRSDRRVHRPFGIGGGEAGRGSMSHIVAGDRKTLLPTMPFGAIGLRNSEVLAHVSAGGGGYGDPYERLEEAVVEDVRDGKVTPEAAAEDYGVVIAAGGSVDRRRTDELRGACIPARKASRPA